MHCITREKNMIQPNTNDVIETNATNDRQGNAKAEEVETIAQKRKRLLVARQETAETATAARIAHQVELPNPSAKAMTAEKAAIRDQESTGKVGLNYVLSKEQKKAIAKEKKALTKRLSTAESKAEFSGFILNEKTDVRRAKIREVKDGEEFTLNAFLASGQTK